MKKELDKIEMYTDGACSGNPGPGGGGTILRFGSAEKELSGGERSTTNNRMELTAVIEGFKALKRPCCATLWHVVTHGTYELSIWYNLSS